LPDVVGFDGALRFDPGTPDGPPRKLMDRSALTSLGWTARTGLRKGIEATYHGDRANEAAR
jgi:GDP-L-fucose synthase